MTSTPAEPRPCSIARTLDLVGEKWALLAVREVFLGNRRFDEMVRRTGAPRDTLAARLRTLTGAGILERRRYSEHPARFEYHLTAAGRDLYPVIVTLMRWGDQYLAGDDGPPLVLQHHCGHQVTAQVICQACGEPLRPRDTKPVAVAVTASAAASAPPAQGTVQATSCGLPTLPEAVLRPPAGTSIRGGACCGRRRSARPSGRRPGARRR